MHFHTYFIFVRIIYVGTPFRSAKNVGSNSSSGTRCKRKLLWKYSESSSSALLLFVQIQQFYNQSRLRMKEAATGR